ncbi:dipeptidylpeptidase [Coemansia sp. RSA 1694]|nr:dipeptidylpeptidase [Coemansia sp. RSA 1836]KAJ2644762.1 dipeptidylpeptidase [Coemansia sp. RSA 1694]
MRNAGLCIALQLACLGLWALCCHAVDGNMAMASKPLSIGLFHSLNRVGAPVISPNQKLALYVTSYYSQDSNRSAAYLSCMDIATGGIVQVTESKPGTSLSNPIWFDDKTFGFLRHGELYKQELRPGAAAVVVYNPPITITSLSYRANSGLISFMASVYPNATLEECAVLKRAEDTKSDSAQVYDNLWARHWNEWMTLEKLNVFVAPLNVSKGVWKVGPEVNLNAALPRCPDSLTRWHVDDYTISPSGSNVAFLARQPAQNMTWSTSVSVYLTSTTGTAKPHLLTQRPSGQASAPVFSSDGRRLAWLQMETPCYESDINRIYIHTIATRETISIAHDWDLSPHSLVWSKDDKTLYTITGSKGHNLIIAVDVETGRRKELTSSGSAGSVRLAENQTALYIYSDQDKAGDIHMLDIASGKSRQMTAANREKLKDVYLSPAEDFWFNGARGDRVHGWLLRPYGFDRRKKYPIAVLIHGGPQQASIQAFTHSQWNPNMYASAGFVTVVINFHGSATYGQNFTNSIRHKWGDYPYVDIMRGIDYVTSRFSFADKNRMAALGGSFGGYMVNWLNGHTDDFKCFVSHDGKFSTISGYYGTDELWFPEWDLGAPWQESGRAVLEVNNPERFASNFKTPTLFIHGEKDFRIPITESLGAWTMLRRRDIPARLVYFPDEDHWINKMGNSIRWYTEVLDWISKWTNTTLPYHIR